MSPNSLGCGQRVSRADLAFDGIEDKYPAGVTIDLSCNWKCIPVVPQNNVHGCAQPVLYGETGNLQI